MLPAITELSLPQLQPAAKEMGLRSYAAWQITSWLYQRLAASFAEMTDLSKEARERLKERYAISAVRLVETVEAADGTQKMLCSGHDDARFESVLIPAEGGRLTVCLSTQAGCAMGCAFCRTAQLGLTRDLTQGEILGQLIAMMRAAKDAVTNVVLMGMGEPLANMDAVSRAVEVMLDERALNLSKRRVTLSTCGLLPQLEAFSRRFDIKIAISLNATTDEVRSQIMPVNRRYPLEGIMAFCREYSQRSRHRVTFEYVLLRDINDRKEDAARLIELLKGVRAKINLIPFNPFAGSAFRAPDPERVTWWHEYLAKRGIQANIRSSRGQEIMAACGQLAGS